MIRIYKTRTIMADVSFETMRAALKDNPEFRAEILETRDYRDYRYRVFVREELDREIELTAKQTAKMLPSWAKHKPIRGIGDKVTAFYRENNKVACDCTGLVVGSDEWHEWMETQPDPFRASRLYLESKFGGVRA